MMKKYLIALVLVITCGAASGQNIAGIGAQLIMDTTGGWSMPRIFALVQGSPAYDSLRATDYIIEVNGTSCKDKPLDAIVALIRGEAGTTVTVTTANTKEGEAPRKHELRRVGMNVPQPADPKDAFLSACSADVKTLKKSGKNIVKTFNSDCGDFFFNFDGGNAQFHIRIYALTDVADKSGKGFTASARVFDNDHEADAISIPALDAKTAVNGVAQTEGAITFTRDCVGTIGISMHDDDKKCRALFVVVYK